MVAKYANRARPAPVCQRCGPQADVKLCWLQMRNGGRQIRRECGTCGRWLGAAPQTSENVAEANRNQLPAPALDALLLADAEGVQLVSDGQAADIAPGHWRKASPALREALQQSRHLLGSMIGKGR